MADTAHPGERDLPQLRAERYWVNLLSQKIVHFRRTQPEYLAGIPEEHIRRVMRVCVAFVAEDLMLDDEESATPYPYQDWSDL